MVLFVLFFLIVVLVVQSLVYAFQKTVERGTCLFHLFHDGFPAVLEDGGGILALQLGYFLQFVLAEVFVGIDFVEQLTELFVSLFPLFLAVVFTVFLNFLYEVFQVVDTAAFRLAGTDTQGSKCPKGDYDVFPHNKLILGYVSLFFFACPLQI